MTLNALAQLFAPKTIDITPIDQQVATMPSQARTYTDDEKLINLVTMLGSELIKDTVPDAETLKKDYAPLIDMSRRQLFDDGGELRKGLIEAIEQRDIIVVVNRRDNYIGYFPRQGGGFTFPLQPQQ